MKTAEVNHMVFATRNDIIGFVYDYLKKHDRKTSFNYQLYKPKDFTEKPFLVPPGIRNEFDKYLSYCYLLSKNFTERDEAAKYRSNHGLSIYFSVVLFWLLINYGVVSGKRLKYCQGYYSYKIRDRSSNEDKPRHRAGVHAWLCWSGSVIDVTLWQQKEYIDFAGPGLKPPVITGNFPQGISLIGFEEQKSLAKEYARQFARESGLTFYQWISYHKNQADLLYEAQTLKEPHE